MRQSPGTGGADTMRYVHRMVGSRADGWYVRVPGRPCRLFSLSTQGGLDAALEKALACRDELARGNPLAYPLGCRPGPRNSSGTVGVRRIADVRDAGVPYEAWVADWMEDGVQRKRYFGVSVHGEDRARELARACRRDHLRPHAGKDRARTA